VDDLMSIMRNGLHTPQIPFGFAFREPWYMFAPPCCCTERSLLTRLPHNLSLVKTIASQPRKQTLTLTSVQQPFPPPRQFSLLLLSHSILNFWKAPPSHERQHALRNSPRSLKIPLPASTTPNSTHPRPTRGSLYPTI